MRTRVTGPSTSPCLAAFLSCPHENTALKAAEGQVAVVRITGLAQFVQLDSGSCD